MNLRGYYDRTPCPFGKPGTVLGSAVVGMLVAVILLMVVMTVVGRKPKTPEPLPEPPVE
jgi:hypothetical protein